jgi:hypothetical protein
MNIFYSYNQIELIQGGCLIIKYVLKTAIMKKFKGGVKMDDRGIDHLSVIIFMTMYL